MQRDTVVITLLVLIMTSSMALVIGLGIQWKIYDEKKTMARNLAYHKAHHPTSNDASPPKELEKTSTSTTPKPIVYADSGIDNDPAPPDALHFFFQTMTDGEEAVWLPDKILNLPVGKDSKSINRLVLFIRELGHTTRASKHLWFKKYDVLKEKYINWTYRNEDMLDDGKMF